MAILLYKWLIYFHLFSGIVAPGNKNPATPSQGSEKVFHPFYVSVTEIAHNEKDKTIEISCKIFTDDLEATLKQNYKTSVDLSDGNRQALNNTYIKDYINKHLKVAADGKVIKLNYVGFEKDNEATYCYFEGIQVPSPKNLDVINSILQDYTNQQINIIHVTVKGKRQSLKLDFPDQKASFSF